MSTTFERLYKLAEGMASQNDEMYMPQPFGDDPEHESTMDPIDPAPLAITHPKEDHNQFTGSLKTADRSNTDESGSPGAVGAPKHVYQINAEDDPTEQMFGDAGETSRGDNSIIMSSLTSNLEARKIVRAYIIENGTPQCSSCGNFYTPSSIANAKLAHCGHCPEDRMDEAMGRTPPGEVHGTWNFPEEARRGNEIVGYGPDDGNPELNRYEEGDVVDGNVIKTAPREASTQPISCPGCGEKTSKNWVNNSCIVCGYKPKEATKKVSNDSELYTRGFLDHLHGKPLDEDLAVLSDDYFNGYDQARYFGKTPLESVGAKPHHVVIPEHIDTSLEGWEQSGIGGQDYHYDIDRSQVIASTLPTNVLEAFFNTEE